MKDTVTFPDEKESLNQEFLKPKIENNQIIQNQNISNQITDQYFIGPESGVPKKRTVPCEKCNAKAFPYLLFLIVSDVFIIPILIFAWYFIPLVAILYIFTIYIFYHFTRRNVEIERKENKNVISIKAINLCGCTYKQLELSNFYFHIGTVYDDRENNHIFYRLFMIKDFKNSSEIDLDTSNIKNIPIKIYDYVDNIWPYEGGVNAVDKLEKELNDLAGVSPDHKCAFHFNIREYMKLEPSEKEKQLEKLKELNPHIAKYFMGSNRGNYSQYMKFCENYFSYYIEELYSEKKGEILRIDFIFSQNFDRIFIGLVNNNEKTYKNTFEFQMNSIDKFILQKIGYEDKGYNLKVNLKNNESYQIYSLKKATQENLRGLAYLLNEKLTNNNGNEIFTIAEGNSPPTPNLDS